MARLAASSKVLRMTTFGSSVRSLSLLVVLMGLVAAEYEGSPADFESSISSAYSGNELKLSGTMTTW